MNIRRNSIIAMALAVLMVFAMMPMVTMPAYADEAFWADSGALNYLFMPDKTGESKALVCGRAADNTADEISIPSSVTYNDESYTIIGIDYGAFNNDQTITKLTVADGITEIADFAFDGCSNLTEVTIPSTVTEIEMSAFNGCPLDTIYFGGSPAQWAAIPGDNKPANVTVNCAKEDVYVTASLKLSVLENNDWHEWTGGGYPSYVTSTVINGTETKAAQVPVGVKTTIVITPAAGYMVSGVSVNGAYYPSGIDFTYQTDPSTAVHTVTFTPQENESYVLSVGLKEAVRVTYDLNGGTAGSNWPGNIRLISKGTTLVPLGYEFEDITPPEGYVLDSVEIIDGSGTHPVAAADLYSTGHTFNSDVTFKCIWKSTKPEPAAQTITASNFTKTYGDAAFSLGAKTSGDGNLTYKSSNTNVAVVSSAGKVTIKGAGTAKITISASATENYKAASKTITLTVNKAANPLKIKPKTAPVKFSKLKNNDQILKVGKVITFTKKGQGTMNYTISSVKKGSKSFKGKITINKKTGKVTVKKGLKKGTYKVKVKVKAKGNANYKASAEREITFKVTIK